VALVVDAFANANIEAQTLTIGGVSLRATDSVSTAFDKDFSIAVTRQGSDYLDKSKILVQLAAPKVAYLKDVKTATTSGGTFTSGAWRKRELNTLEGDSSFISISSSQITLQPGSYLIEAELPAWNVDRHQGKFRNITDSTDDLIGSSSFGSVSNEGFNSSKIFGEVIITSEKIFEIQHRCLTTVAARGFGVESNFGINNIYTQVKITKVA